MKRIEAAFSHASTQYIEALDTLDSSGGTLPTAIPETLIGGAPAHPLLNIYLTAGYPHLDSTGELLLALSEAGVDFIVLGMPYSDPLADGDTIQASSAQALRNGITLERIFEQVRSVRASVKPPILLMGYYNQVTRFGRERFLDACTASGVDGLILPDLPLDVYESEFRAELERRDLGISFLVTPRTPMDRVRRIDALCRGFLYVVSSSSTTGSRAGVEDEAAAYFQRLDEADLVSPRLIGFNISSRADLARTTQYAAGGIIGSAFIRALDAADVVGSATRFVASLR